MRPQTTICYASQRQMDTMHNNREANETSYSCTSNPKPNSAILECSPQQERGVITMRGMSMPYHQCLKLTQCNGSEVFLQYRISKTTVSNYLIQHQIAYLSLKALWNFYWPTDVSLLHEQLVRSSPSFFKVTQLPKDHTTQLKENL